MLSTTKHYEVKINENTYEGITGGKPYRIRWVSVNTGYVNGIEFNISWNPDYSNTYFKNGVEVELSMAEWKLCGNAILQTRRDWYKETVKFDTSNKKSGSSCNGSIRFRTNHLGRIEMKIHGGAWQGRGDKNHHIHRGIVEAMHS